MYDMIIIGAGPAGMAAAIYAGRAKLNAIMFEKEFPGGQVTKTYEVANYPGIADVIGPDLALKMQAHAKEYGIEPIVEEVIEIDVNDKIKKVKTNKNTYEARTLLLGMGATWRELGVPGEKKLKARGVSYCATCDGAFFNGKNTVVVGGGNTGVEDAILLAKFSPKVYVIQDLPQLTAQKILQDTLFSLDNVEVFTNHQVLEILGEDSVQGIKIKNKETGEQRVLDVEGVFVAVGMTPNSELVKGKVEINEWGYIKANENCETNIPGVYAIGDIRDKKLRQIITATADGAIAVSAAEKYILENP
ncbi:MAG: thioredoxin reductase [Epulopiscium sp.]|jgi:thioredoxin reductase (NADPH)|uniref:Thioredoxin reductase n=1 Tax=Defluviitalea raffinosedens TaxID=1450156 RepID=A0A7C8HEC8_9FIRM|nr:thioredoxin-disulfide reductase [Defluviitalea raffinosedens]MBZ4667357.1 thioredoxin-disulfide reductase [Defluviitaleaceae bacterium]MDK2787849.1 thioredoxin reductase [Candidatus Epulonipiscium sp.]KAE9632926.1 thioredoxin-disulfide reductase [Defluviitalea raffinosedens]MBM7684622.1 thioredoxin reductase (NADPH) [Defluviitalea raffinosedens]HHW68277.1 thioredoxin-disulfide reductase [Candidatus Epulonipiscium sp.]